MSVSEVELDSFLPSSPRSLFLGRIPGILYQPLVILGWQILSCASTWTFVVVLASRGQIPVSDATALLIDRYQAETTFIATLIATILSTTTTWFFHAAIRQAIVPFLSRRVSLFQLCSAIEFSMGSVVLNKNHIGWTVSTILSIGLLGTLTSAWSSIISPITIVLSIPVSGQEVDITTRAWLDWMAWDSSWPPSPQISSSALSKNLDLFQTYDEEADAAGISAAMVMFEETSILSFLIGAFNVSTGGIIAVNNPMDPANQAWGSSNLGNVYPYVTPVGDDYYQGLSVNQALNQQGLTANVSCQSQNFTDPSVYPYIVLKSKISTLEGQYATWYMTSWSWNTTCSDSLSFVMEDAFTFSQTLYGSFLAGSVCPLQSFSGPSNQSFLISLQFNFPNASEAAYSGSQLCEVTPLLTTVQTAYGGGIINIGQTLSSSTFDQIDSSGLMVYYIGQFIAEQLYSSQASSIFGNYLLTKMYDFLTSERIPFANVSWNLFFEDYWRGLVEGYITELRIDTIFNLTDMSASAIPENMSKPVDGLMQVTTKGWKFSKIGSLVALLPITATFIISVLALLFPRSSRHLTNSQNDNLDKHVVFNPSSILNVIRASAAGGVSNSLQGLRTADVSDGDGCDDAHSLFIGFTEDNKIGFVESETAPFVPYRVRAKKGILKE